MPTMTKEKHTINLTVSNTKTIITITTWRTVMKFSADRLNAVKGLNLKKNCGRNCFAAL